MLWLQTSKTASGTMNLGGSLTRQVTFLCLFASSDDNEYFLKVYSCCLDYQLATCLQLTFFYIFRVLLLLFHLVWHCHVMVGIGLAIKSSWYWHPAISLSCTVKPVFFVCPLFRKFCNLGKVVKLNSRRYSKSRAVLLYYFVQQAKTQKIKGAKIIQ